jgi:hypothetical protein
MPSTGGAHAEAYEEADSGLDEEAVDQRRAHAKEADLVRACGGGRRRTLRLMRRRSTRA